MYGLHGTSIPRMKYRRLGRAGIKVSEISLGGWLTYGRTIDQETTRKIVHRAFDLGITFFDLADIYAKGEAERAIAPALADLKRSDLVVSSKLFWPMSDNPNDRGLSRKHIHESIDGTLRRLGTDYLDIYFCHRYDPETEVDEVVRAMDDLVRAGKILYWGTSVWEHDQISTALREADRFLAYRPVVEQPRYNILDRHIETDIAPLCRTEGIGLVVWSPLAEGVLTGKYLDGIPKGSRGTVVPDFASRITADERAKVIALKSIAEKLGITLAQLALAWVLHNDAVSSAITGATRLEQLESNVRAAEITLHPDTLQEIDMLSRTAHTKG